MTDGQHLALGLVFVILAVRWLLPDKAGKSKLIDIIGAAWSSAPSVAGGTVSATTQYPGTALV